MSKVIARFPREALKESRDENIWPFLQEVAVQMEIEPPIHRIYAYDRNNNRVPFSWLLAAKSGRTKDSFPFLTLTKKMNCLSWSLPAGNPNVGGTCFMEGGQQKSYICRYCYAGKGFYTMYPDVQVAQAVRYKWLNETSDWVERMIHAIARSYEKNLASIGVDANKFFRIHDSGDFFSEGYLVGWFDVIREFPNINFWAPTRMWARPEFNDWISAAGGIPDNLALRPSSLHFNKRPPDVDGYAAGSTANDNKFGSVNEAIQKGKGFFVTLEGQTLWECPAYRTEAGSCLGVKDIGITAASPYGCRMCWLGKGAGISYKGH